MTRKVVVIAPHPDDETLGCGGTLLRHKKSLDEIHWIIVTGITENMGYSTSVVDESLDVIKQVAKSYQFDSIHQLNLPPSQLDTIAMSDIIEKIGAVFNKITPDIVYLPFRNDVHSDHKYVFDATVACSKWFRYSSISRVLAYETLSETEFSLNPDGKGFHPNVFVDIGAYLDMKIKIIRHYKNEIAEFPFPRSEQAIKAQATLRGATAGYQAAEAFMLLKEKI